ncbi:MAG: cation:proton antiporter [Thermoplasmata archaeon]
MTLLSLSGTSLLVLLLGMTLLVGFGAHWLFRRFRVPDVLWLIALGVVAGPLFGLLAPSTLLGIAPLLGTTALVLILFDAGLDLRVALVRPLVGSALIFAVTTYVAATVIIFAVSDLVLVPGHVVLSLLFATALGPTSGAVVIPLANALGLEPGLRSVVQLDSAVEDAISIVVVTTLLTLVTSTSSSLLALNLTTALILPLPVGILVGLAAGLVWFLFLYEWQDLPFAALATLGFLFVVYAITEALGGSGIFMAIVFGVMIGNAGMFRRFLRRWRPFHISEDLRKVEVELAFVLRAFFLFLVGALVTLVAPTLVTAIVIVALVVALYYVRRLTFRAVTNPRKIPVSWGPPVAALYGRGLTSAVLLILGAETFPEIARLFLPAILIIVGTNVVMTVGIFTRRPRPAVTDGELERRWADLDPGWLTLASDDGRLIEGTRTSSAPTIPTPTNPKPSPSHEPPSRPPLPKSGR